MPLLTAMIQSALPMALPVLFAPTARPPSRGIIPDPQPAQMLKFNLRDYAYAGRVQWVAARLDQTAHFRTPGGGFAPVYEAPA